jgi:hypothetical protein
VSGGTIVVVESAAALAFARVRFPEARWATMSPYVTETLRRDGIEPLVIDTLVTAAEADAVGFAAIDAAKGAAAAIDACTEWPHGVKPGTALLFDQHRAIAALGYKALLLQHLRDRSGADLRIVGTAALSPVDGFGVQPGRFDTLFAALADAVGAETIAFSAPPPRGAQANGDFAQTAWWTRAVTFLNAPGATLFNRLLRRAARSRPRRFRPGGADFVAGIFSSNELVEETALALAKAGARLIALPKFPSARPAHAPLMDAPGIAGRVAHAIRRAFAEAKFEGPALARAAAIAGARSTDALGRVAAIAAEAESYCARLAGIAAGRPFAMLANAMSAPSLQILGQRMKARGQCFYVFEHGTGPGLDDNHDALYGAGMAPVVDGAVYYNDHQRGFAEGARGGAQRRGIVAGAPAMARRIGARGLQRRLARRAVSPRGKRVVGWLTGLYPNNMPFLPHYYRDGSYHELRRCVVNEVLGRLDDDVLLKLYPTMRHADPDPFAGLMSLPPNCRAVWLVDFRNIRAAFDVIVIDEPGSALAWCWGTGVPIVILDTEMHLNAASAAALREAAFYIDTAAPGWQRELAGLLALPHAELLRRWDAMAERRRAVSEHMVLGPAGSPGRRAAEDILADMAGAERAMPAAARARAAE